MPDFPDVSVQIPQSCVPVNQDFCITIKVHGTMELYSYLSPATFFNFPVSFFQLLALHSMNLVAI